MNSVRLAPTNDRRLLGVMNEFILNQAPDPRDREHRLRAVLAAPNTPDL